jgi:lysine-specific demethylase 8
MGWRVLYAVAVRGVIFYDALLNLEEVKEEKIADWIRALDLACMTTTPGERGRIQDLIKGLAEFSAQNSSDTTEDEIIQQPRQPTQAMYDQLFRSSQAPNKGEVSTIERVQQSPSLMEFYQNYMNSRTPVIIPGLLNEWPAFGKTSGSDREWANISYLKRQAGLRTVPVETGDHYMAGNWGQELIRFDQFVDRYVLGKGTKLGDTKTTGYLAQHPLLDQIPELRQDIIVPDYCALSDESDAATGEVQIHSWFGPSGTLSCLHNDPYNNLLAQVVGWKRVVLVDDEYRERLYPHPGIMSNTSQLDPDKPDLNEFPQFSGVPLKEALIGPGDTLYIPQGCWHQIKSLSVSFSVSFWW